MKKKNLLFKGILLFLITLGTASCTFGGDDKKDEIVENPLDEIQYLITGTVCDNKDNLLDGVEVSVGDNKTMTANGGQYSITVASTREQNVTFKKSGLDTHTAQPRFTSEQNHSQAILNVTLAKAPDLVRSEEVVVSTTAGAIIKAPYQEDENADPAVITIPAGGVSVRTNIKAVVYEPAVDINATTASFSSIYVEATPTNAVSATSYSIAVNNPGDSKEYFDEASMAIVKQDALATKANGTSIAFDGNANKYIASLPENTKLAGNYFLNLNFTKTAANKTGDYNPVVYNGKVYNTTAQIEDTEYEAMKNLKLTVQAKYGWAYSVEPQAALIKVGASGALAETIKSYIRKIEGKQTYTQNEEYTASVSGHKVLFFSSRQNIAEKTYTFKVKVNGVSKSVAVKLICFYGHTINYVEKDLGDHSGGTTGGQN